MKVPLAEIIPLEKGEPKRKPRFSWFQSLPFLHWLEQPSRLPLRSKQKKDRTDRPPEPSEKGFHYRGVLGERPRWPRGPVLGAGERESEVQAWRFQMSSDKGWRGNKPSPFNSEVRAKWRNRKGMGDGTHWQSPAWKCCGPGAVLFVLTEHSRVPSTSRRLR